jgi:hypothetical protein
LVVALVLVALMGLLIRMGVLHIKVALVVALVGQQLVQRLKLAVLAVHVLAIQVAVGLVGLLEQTELLEQRLVLVVAAAVLVVAVLRVVTEVLVV